MSRGASQEQEERKKGQLGQPPTKLVGRQQRFEEAPHQHDQQEAAQAGVHAWLGLGPGCGQGQGQGQGQSQGQGQGQGQDQGQG